MRRMLLAGFTLAFGLLSPGEVQGRSFVGKKLPDFDFVDTEGRKVNPTHYYGSVLVMITGVPW